MRTLETIMLADGDVFRAHPQAGVPAGERPAAIAAPRSVDEVRAVVEHAAERGWRIAVHTTGRGVRQTGPLHDTLLVRTDALGGAHLLAAEARVRAGGGARWADVTAAVAPAGLAALSIPTPGVGVAGTVLAGGVGWLGRRHGLASESLRAAEIVTADGVLRRADAEHERDLFWALRGGGGGVGLITAVELALVAPPALHAGALRWPAVRAPEVLHAWRDWTTAVPREVTSMARLVGAAREPEVLVEAVLLADAARAAELLAPLRALGPAADSFGDVGPGALDALHADVLGERPIHYDHVLLDDLPREALDEALEVLAPAGAALPLLDVELRHLGGALDDRGRQAGALGALDAGYLLVVAAEPGDAAVADAAVEALSPWAAGHIFLSFAGAATTGADVFVAAAQRRLLAVKALYDPDDRFVSPLGSG